MADEPNSISRMKAFYANRLYVEDASALQLELMGGNDRSAIITVAAICDASLEARLATSLPALRNATEKEVNLAFRHEGPLGTFSARIDMAFYMELIDAKTRGQLHDLRHIRNAVAHTKRRVTFTDDELKNVARRIIHPTGMYKLLSETPEGFRRTLIAEGMFLWNVIQHGREASVEAVRATYLAANKPVPF